MLLSERFSLLAIQSSHGRRQFTVILTLYRIGRCDRVNSYGNMGPYRHDRDLLSLHMRKLRITHQRPVNSGRSLSRLTVHEFLAHSVEET